MTEICSQCEMIWLSKGPFGKYVYVDDEDGRHIAPPSYYTNWMEKGGWTRPPPTPLCVTYHMTLMVAEGISNALEYEVD